MTYRAEEKVQTAQPHPFMRTDRPQIHAIQQAVFGELVFHQRQRERRTIDGQRIGQHALVLRNHPGKSADMILMSVRQHHAQRTFTLREQGIEQRNDDIHAHLRIIGEHEAAVDQHRALAALPLLAVQAYFSKSPQRGDGKMPFRHVNSLNIFPGRGRPSGRTTHLNKSHGKTARIRRGRPRKKIRLRMVPPRICAKSGPCFNPQSPHPTADSAADGQEAYGLPLPDGRNCGKGFHRLRRFVNRAFLPEGGRFSNHRGIFDRVLLKHFNSKMLWEGCFRPEIFARPAFREASTYRAQPQALARRTVLR